MSATVHNPDRYMSDLRQILAQGRKRIGILLGAGAPVGVKINRTSGKLDDSGEPLIPDVKNLTRIVFETIDSRSMEIISEIRKDLTPNHNIELILSRVRSFALIVGRNKLFGCDGPGFIEVAKNICTIIGNQVGVSLPEESNPYTELAGWIGGSDRKHPVEIFTPNYDLLMEEALERSGYPYFDGFSGSHEPFFDPSSIANNDLPSRWTRLWKLHGSLGWCFSKKGKLVRGKGKSTSELIYPDHLKYDQTQKLPYAAYFERLRNFLLTEDTLLISCGFSFSDSHISAALDDALGANLSASLFAFQFNKLSEENYAIDLAKKRPNISVYTSDGAMINCIEAKWSPGEYPSPNWLPIRTSFWDRKKGEEKESFLLGDYKHFSRFFALSRADQVNIPQKEALGLGAL